VAVFADVDFIADGIAYQLAQPFNFIVAQRDNGALLLNVLEDLSGSGDLISIRSRGNVQRPFTVVDKIENEAEKATAQKVAELQAKINGFAQELSNLQASAKKKEQAVVESAVVQKIKQLQQAKWKTEKELRQVNKGRFKEIEDLGNLLRCFNMLLAPAIILLIAIVLGLWRNVKHRHYISHASDA